jgi:hypothetical protein
MSSIKADPADLRGLADDLRRSAAHVRDLGDQAIAAAASARSPAAAGTMVEAASFAAGARMTEVEIGQLASGTDRVAGMFELADRGGGWFSRGALAAAVGRGLFGFKILNNARRIFNNARKIFKNVPHSTRPKDWRRWSKELLRGRGPRAAFWGFTDARKKLNSWGRSRWQTLTHPKSSVVKFVSQGRRAVENVGKNKSLMKRVAPLAKFGGKLFTKVAKPFNIIQSYRNSKVRNPIGKVVSVVASTVLTKNPVSLVVDIASGGQVTRGVDGVINTIASADDSQRLTDMSVANAKGENGWAMQGIQFAGDGLADGIYGGWSWLTHGH